MTTLEDVLFFLFLFYFLNKGNKLVFVTIIIILLLLLFCWFVIIIQRCKECQGILQFLDKDINIKGQDILIIEPLDRVGGRTYKLTQDCDRIPNHPVDVGGAWICPEQKSIWKLCEEQGMEIVAQESPPR